MDPFVVLSICVGCLFLYAASFKVLDSSALRVTLRELGCSERLSDRGARLIPAFEVVVAFAAQGVVPTAVGASLVLLAALGIGAAGVAALRSGTQIRCSCFSADSTNVLGRHQLVTATLLAGASVALAIRAPEYDIQRALAQIAVVGLLVSAIHVGPLVRALQIARHNRRAVASLYRA